MQITKETVLAEIEQCSGDFTIRTIAEPFISPSIFGVTTKTTYAKVENVFKKLQIDGVIRYVDTANDRKGHPFLFERVQQVQKRGQEQEKKMNNSSNNFTPQALVGEFLQQIAEMHNKSKQGEFDYRLFQRLSDTLNLGSFRLNKPEERESLITQVCDEFPKTQKRVGELEGLNKSLTFHNKGFLTQNKEMSKEIQTLREENLILTTKVQDQEQLLHNEKTAREGERLEFEERARVFSEREKKQVAFLASKDSLLAKKSALIKALEEKLESFTTNSQTVSSCNSFGDLGTLLNQVAQ